MFTGCSPKNRVAPLLLRRRNSVIYRLIYAGVFICYSPASAGSSDVSTPNTISTSVEVSHAVLPLND